LPIFPSPHPTRAWRLAPNIAKIVSAAWGSPQPAIEPPQPICAPLWSRQFGGFAVAYRTLFGASPPAAPPALAGAAANGCHMLAERE
jgi:hypothetical protein